MRQRLLSFLADPNVVAILMLLGTLGIGIEFYHPGMILPGAVGGLCLLLAFLAMRVIPVNAGAVVLLLVGVGLLVAEGYMTTHGIAGRRGRASASCSGLAFFIDRASPDYRFAPAAFTRLPVDRLADAVVLARAARVHGLEDRGLAPARRCSSARRALVGARGRARSSDVGPAGGEAFVHGEYWQARSARPIPKGARVRVVAVDGLTVTVVADSAAAGRRQVPRRRARAGARAERRPGGSPMPLIGLGHSPSPLVLLWFLSGIRIIERVRAGRGAAARPVRRVRTAGLKWIIPFIDRMIIIDMRITAEQVPPQDVITRDNVSVKVNAVIYFRVMQADRAFLQVTDFLFATSQFAQTTLRSVLGQVELDDLLSQRDKINRQLQEIIDRHTEPWGVKVTAVEVKQVDLPDEMRRAMAKQAEAERERRVEDHRGRGRVPGRGEARAGRRRHRPLARRAAAPLPPDARRDLGREELHHHVPAPHRLRSFRCAGFLRKHARDTRVRRAAGAGRREPVGHPLRTRRGSRRPPSSTPAPSPGCCARTRPRRAGRGR